MGGWWGNVLRPGEAGAVNSLGLDGCRRIASPTLTFVTTAPLVGPYMSSSAPFAMPAQCVESGQLRLPTESGNSLHSMATSPSTSNSSSLTATRSALSPAEPSMRRMRNV